MRVLSGYLVAMMVTAFVTLASLTWITGMGLEHSPIATKSAVASLVDLGSQEMGLP